VLEIAAEKAPVSLKEFEGSAGNPVECSIHLVQQAFHPNRSLRYCFFFRAHRY
jgi:hypothetical protein